mmetsp:Transcript_11570/g.46606  ORF Transcript_11570/g.46606 Transcript_11570/m.46606 type:complete len:211 (-) Transcript_11570:127-759(-)
MTIPRSLPLALIHLLQLCYNAIYQMPCTRPAGTSGYLFFNTYCHLFFADCLDRPVAAAIVFQSMDRSPCTRILMINSSSSGVHRTRSLLPSITGVFIIASRSGKPTGVLMAKATDGFALVEGVDIAFPPAANGVPASAAIVAHPLSLKGSDDASRPASEVSRPSSCVMFSSSPSCVVNPKLAAAAAKASSASGNIASGPSGQKWLSSQIG